jgi:GAF domain-containing protein/CheY-like chemotaxis protein/HAMP domain-containing protein
MLRKLSIQTQLAIVLILALVLLTLGLQVLQTVQARASLIQAEQKRSRALIADVNTTIQAISPLIATMSDLQGVDQRLASLVEQNKDIDFIAITWPDGTVIGHSDPAYTDQTIAALANLSASDTVRRTVPDFGTVYLTSARYENPVEGPAYYSVVVGAAAAPIDRSLWNNALSSVPVALAAIALIGVITVFILRRNVSGPLGTVSEGARRFSQGQLDYRIQPTGSLELYDLGSALNNMARQMQQSREELVQLYRGMEARVEERTRDLQMSAEIGRIATSLRDIDTLLAETVEQIRRRFDVIYHAQIFLLDHVGENAVLVQSTGEAGRQLLASGHKLPVGSNSVIGRVTGRGHAVMASDTRRGDVPWQPNPLLPHTRAEMALPLMIEGRVMGALDVQSTQPDVFTEDMVRIFGVLADQLAIAIENARLLTESDRRLQEIDHLNRQLTRSSWQEYIEEKGTQPFVGYLYDQLEITPLTGDTPPHLTPNRAEGPIQVHGETVGTLVTALASDEPLSRDEHLLVSAVAERVALAVENARLFEQTQRALAETERLYEAARTISSAADLETVYRLVAEQISTISNVDNIEVLLSGPDPLLIQHLETAFTWRRQISASRLGAREQLRVLALSHAEYGMLPAADPVIYVDVAHELSHDHPLKPKFNSLNARSVLLLPLTAGGRWYGLLLCSGQHPGGFSGPYVTFASALADQLAIAIENRRLYEEAQAEARRTRALAEAGQLASQIGGDFAEGLQNLFQAVARPGNYDRWWFGLLSEDNTHLNRIMASDEALPESIDIQHDSITLAEAARIGEIVLVNDPADHPVTADQPADVARQWGKHIVMPVRIGSALVGVLQIGRSLDEQNLDERDIQLVATLASQVAVATQNQRLFDEAESQRQRLQTIVDTMPTGILVMDRAGQVVLSNDTLVNLLGPELRPDFPDHPTPYPIVHAGDQTPYPRQEWPLSRVLSTGEPAMADDMLILHPRGEINVMAQAAPVFGPAGEIIAAVAAFQDITELQTLERALQDSLRETTLLYEASRAIARAAGMDDLLEVTLTQTNWLTASLACIFLRDLDNEGELAVTLAASHPPVDLPQPDINALSVMFKSEPVVVQSDEALSQPVADYLQRRELATAACFPLNVRGFPNGWIVIAFAQSQPITTEIHRYMTTLADQAGISIENQRLFVHTEEALQETSLLYHASRMVSDAQSPAEILSAFSEHVMALPVGFASLYALLSDTAATSYAAIEVLTTWGSNPAAAPGGTRYRASQFPFWDAATGTTIIHIDHVSQAGQLDDLARIELNALNAQALTIIPLRVAGRAVGAVVIGYDQPGALGEQQTRIFEALADQAAIALENTRLYRQAQRRARQLSTAAEISRAVTSILYLGELLPQVVDLIRRSFEYDHVQIFLLSADGQDANLVASTGEAGRKLLDRHHSLPVGSQSVIGQVTATGQPQIALDTADARVVHRPNPILPFTRSEMALPLTARGQIVGALDVQSNQPRAFTDEDAQMLASLADMVATAIDNARLFELAEQRAEEMGFLFNVTTAAAASPDLSDALTQVVETLRATLRVTNASIYLPDESGQVMIKGSEIGSADSEARLTHISIDRGVIGWVTRHRQAVIIDDIAQDPRRLSEIDSSGSIIAVPLETAGTLVGVLAVESSRVRDFGDDDLRLLRTLSGSLSAIIQNSRLLSEVQQANERLREVDKLKTNFLAAMSHELRTPLNSIIGFSRVILKGIDGPLTDMQEQDLATIFDSGKHLLGLVNDILDQAKLEAGKMELTRGYFKAQEVITGVMSSAVGLTRDKPIRLHTEIEDNLPDVYGDEFRTRQVLLNLISNASKFTNEGSITVSAFPIVEDDQAFVQISVSDTGIGIAEKDMPQLFEAFQQIDNSLTRTVGGTGMGLPLAKTLTELQGGRIWVESEPGVGSTFSITIPVAPPSADETDETGATADEVEHAPSQGPQAGPQRQTILVVEEDLQVVSLYRRYLSREGYEVLGVNHTDAVMTMVSAHPPDVILLDVNISDQAGWDILEYIKGMDAFRDIPVIICTLNPDRQRGLDMGAASYLVKPFDNEQLLAAIRQAEVSVVRQRILIVDDRPESVRPFRAALEATHRYEILEVTSGHDALDILRLTGTIDLVILDLRMPGLDGFKVIQALRESERTAAVPVLVLTAEDVNAEERAILDSIDVYRKDTLDEEDLLDRVETRLNTTRENR